MTTTERTSLAAVDIPRLVNAAARAAAAFYGIDRQAILRASRTDRVVAARRAVLAVLHECGMTQAEIARIFGKSWSAVSYQLAQHRRRLAAEKSHRDRRYRGRAAGGGGDCNRLKPQS